MPDQLLDTLMSSRRLFWEENRLLPENEIQERWDQRFAYLNDKLGVNLAAAMPLSLPLSLPSKRPVLQAQSFGDPRPAKRPNLVPLLPPTTRSFGPTPSQALKAAPTQPLQPQLSPPAKIAMRRRSSQRAQPQSTPPILDHHHALTPPINIPRVNFSPPSALSYRLGPASPVRSLPIPQYPGLASGPHLGCDDLQDFSPADYLSTSSHWQHSPDEYAMPRLSVNSPPITTPGEFGSQPLSQSSLSASPGSAYAPYLTSTNMSGPSMTSASTATTEPMSRISTNDLLAGPLGMVRIESQASSADRSEPTTGLADLTHHSSFEAQSTIPTSMGSSLSINNFPDPFPSSPFLLARPFLHNATHSSVDMLPSLSQQSNESTSSSSSTHSRQSRRVQDHILQSKRPLEPKPHSSGSQVPVPASATKIVDVVAENGTTTRKALIPRASPPTKETTKVCCPICNDHQDGFHGEHELRRHIDRVHNDLRKVFVCKDISPDGTFLAGCKRCRNHKAYGANYGAAAHLRRVHFNPCQPPKGGRGKVSQHRGGIGGGEYPPMEVLRKWMVETWEPNLSRTALPGSTITHPSFTSTDIPQYPDSAQPSDADLAFAQDAVDFDMSFLPYADGVTLDMSLNVSPSEHTFHPPLFQDPPFFDDDYTT